MPKGIVLSQRSAISVAVGLVQASMQPQNLMMMGVKIFVNGCWTCFGRSLRQMSFCHLLAGVTSPTTEVMGSTFKMEGCTNIRKVQRHKWDAPSELPLQCS